MANNDLRGTVTDSGGNPVQGATVVAFEQDNITNIASVTTDSNGEYVIDPSVIEGDGPWHVTARWDDGSGNQYNSLSKPYVSADISPNVAIIDSWESGDFSAWDSVQTGWTTQSSFVTDGSLGARYSESQSDTITRTSGVDRLPEQGDIFKLDFQTDLSTANSSSNECRVHWADNGTDWYEVHLSVADGNIEFWLRGGTNDRPLNMSHDFAADTHYQLTVEWDDGTLGGSAGDFTITLTDMDAGTDVASGTANDTNHTGPGNEVSIQMNINEQVTWDFDNWRITNP